jgi:hypothetical protein
MSDEKTSQVVYFSIEIAQTAVLDLGSRGTVPQGRVRALGKTDFPLHPDAIERAHAALTDPRSSSNLDAWALLEVQALLDIRIAFEPSAKPTFRSTPMPSSARMLP